MTPFAWLCIGHLIGDWMLQNDWMARDKRGRPWGAPCLVHCVVYTLTVTLVYWAVVVRGESPAGVWAAGVFAGLIFLTHWVIDGVNLPKFWGKYMGQSENATVQMVVDQSMHLIVLAVALVWIGW